MSYGGIKKAGNYLFIILGCTIIIIGQGLAQEDTIPTSIKKNCVVTKEGYIDTCPAHWETLQKMNEMLMQVRTLQENRVKTAKDLSLMISKFTIQLQTMKRNLFLKRNLSEENIFTIDYLSYLMKIYKEEIQANPQWQGCIKKTFSKTYYNQIQSGLIIESIGIFPNAPKPQTLDTKIKIQVSIRNFEETPYVHIEDIYCFATVGTEDYVFPLGMQGEMMKANNITNIVGDLKFETNTQFTEIPGDKKLYCMLAYLDGEKDTTSPFFEFIFPVE